MTTKHYDKNTALWAEEIVQISSSKTLWGVDITRLIDEISTEVFSCIPRKNHETSLDKGQISVVDKKTMQCLYESENLSSTLTLNFASSQRVWWYFENGIFTQEDEIMTHTLLYPSLSEAKDFYKPGKHIWSEKLIISKNIPLVRRPYWELVLSQDILQSHFASLAAPNKRRLKDTISEEEIQTKISQRIWLLLDYCEKETIQRLILWAWWCGAFWNNPVQVARTFKQEFEKRYIPEVIFAIPIMNWNTNTYDIFKNIFS